jgi:hypothetical protein
VTLRTWAHSGATFSPCGRYRYLLWRAWSDGPRAVWIMLNPSTADENAEDPTIRRCIGFTRSWGLSGLFILNAFALRSTDPKALYGAEDPAGPLNDVFLRVGGWRALNEKAPIVCAWGTHAQRLGGAARVLAVLRHRPLSCLGRNRDGSPKHPLYLPASSELVAYP